MAMRSWSDGPFLLAAAPGAGKTRPALEHARALLKAGVVRRVAVVCPTTPLTRQWARAAARLGVHLVPDAAQAAAEEFVAEDPYHPAGLVTSWRVEPFLNVTA